MNQLAIVIPYYKIDFFEETLQSIATQTNKNFTLYIGNDASPNSPLPLIQKYFKDTDYKYFDYQENLGGKNLAMQWERILENVSEEWFQILGDDDMLYYDFVEKFYQSLNFLDQQSINVLKFPIEIIDANNVTIRKFSFENTIIDPRDFLISKIEHKSLSSLSENIFRAEAYSKYKIKQFPLAWHSDDYMIFEYAENNKILYIKDTYVLVRMSEKNISSMTDNVDVKHMATSEFFNYIIANYYKNFSNIQKKIILGNLKKHIYCSQNRLHIKTLIAVYLDNFSEGLKLTKYLF
jgi:hypothetical protein